MTANSIRMRSGYADYFAFGTHFVSAKIRVLDLNEHGIEATSETKRYGIPRLSPHTIWAVKEAPEQAIDNHYRASLHYVDQDPATGSRRKVSVDTQCPYRTASSDRRECWPQSLTTRTMP